MEFTLFLTVTNHFGVLNRITGVFTKRGCNISHLEVHPSPLDPTCSSMRIAAAGTTELKEQVIRNLKKLYDVCSVEAAER